MWTDFIAIMTAPRVGWVSASGLVAVALLAVAVIKYAIGDASQTALLLSGAINLAALTMDYRRNT